MGEIDRDGSSSQRELSQRLNISLGLVNTFLKRLVNKGYFKVKTMPRNRLKYFLTPEGLARKSKLTAQFLQYSVNFYTDIKELLLNKYEEMEAKEIRSVLFYGAGEVAELAYLYLQLTHLKLAGIIDEDRKGKNFFGVPIRGFDSIKNLEWDMVLLTQLDDTEKAVEKLAKAGIARDRIASI
jgi:DNA-binding MarR family transcriptional regulator